MDNKPQRHDTVVAMNDFRSNNGYSAIAQVEAYWEGLRQGRLMPKRSEIDPRGIEGALEHAFILERIAASVARLRIAGSHLSDLMGMEVRGMPITSFVNPPSRRQLSDALEEVFQRPATCELRLAADERQQAPFVARMILLPLKSDFGDVSRILGCLVAHGGTGRGAVRFDITGSTVRRLGRSDTLPEADGPSERAPAPTPQAMSEDAAPFRHKSPAGKVPYLRLIKTDD